MGLCYLLELTEFKFGMSEMGARVVGKYESGRKIRISTLLPCLAIQPSKLLSDGLNLRLST